jgi:hypothetical protein
MKIVADDCQRQTYDRISRQTPATISIFGNNFQLIQFHCSFDRLHIASVLESELLSDSITSNSNA